MTIGKVSIIEGESVVEWKITDFFSLPAKADTDYLSPPFTFANASWCLNIYPNCEKRQKSVGCVDLYLQRKSPGHPISLTFLFGLKTRDEKIDKVVGLAFVFKKPYGHGCTFISRSELFKRRFELAPFDILTVVCKLKYPGQSGIKSLGNAVKAKCSFCNTTLQNPEDVSSHEKKCLDKPIKCPDCGDVVALKSWYDHNCQMVDAGGKTSNTECSNCKENLDAENSSWHEILCPGKPPAKVPEISDTNTIRNLNDNEFQMVNEKGTTATEMCSYCKKLFDPDGISMHEKVCMDKPIKCQECCDMVTLRSMYDHKCQSGRTKGEQTSLKQSENANVLSHESMNQPMKCLQCSVAIDSEKWKDHKNLMERAEAIKKLLNDLKKLMLSGDHSDTTIKVKVEEFRLHKGILSVRNPFFEAMFKNGNGEKTADIVHITDCEPDQFRSLIHYIYTGTADELSPENVCDLYEMADSYQEERMKAECLQLLMKTVSVDNFCDVIVLALKHNDQELRKVAEEFFAAKAKEITRNSKWRSFFKSYPEQADELYMKALECDTA